MFTDPILDPMGALIRRGRADGDVAALVGNRVRGPKPGAGDSQGPGAYQAFVTIAGTSVPPHPSLPITFGECVMNAYGTTYQNAWAVYAALVKAFHKQGPWEEANGQAFYQSIVVQGGEEDTDPDTGQPVVRSVVRFSATLVPIEVGS